MAGTAYAALNSPEEAEEDPVKLIEIEGIRMTVFKGERKAYDIAAERGTLNEETRVVRLERPHVEIYGADGEVKERIRGERGRLWPVKIAVKDEKGRDKELSKYDWELEGGISFDSVDGYDVRAQRIVFSAANSTLVSKEEVAYRLPSGRGSVLNGKAREFEAVVDQSSSAMTKWKMTGPGEISIEPEEEAPEKPDAPPAEEKSK